MTDWEAKIEQTFFLAYHLGMSHKITADLTAYERQQIINLYIQSRRKDG